MADGRTVIPLGRIESLIFLVRGQKVMLSTHVAGLYDVERRALRFHRAGVAMLSSALRSKRAVMVNIEIMRVVVRLRQMHASNAELARKLAALEK